MSKKVFFFFKQKTAYEMLRSLVGSEICIRDRAGSVEAGGKLRPRVQIRTIAELFKGNRPDLPPVHDIISAAAAARRSVQRKEPPAKSADEIRKSPSFKLPIAGGKKKGQKDLPLDEPLLITPRETQRTRRGRR